MLGSRYLYPYFGGGIGTWAGLISTVLSALTIGYLAGGSIADRYPSSRVLAAASALASVYLVLIPLTADHVMSWILNVIGDGPWGILVAAAGLLLLPLSFLGTFSPIAIRLLVHSARASGRVAGLCVRYFNRRQRFWNIVHHFHTHSYDRVSLDHLFIRVHSGSVCCKPLYKLSKGTLDAEDNRNLIVHFCLRSAPTLYRLLGGSTERDNSGSSREARRRVGANPPRPFGLERRARHGKHQGAAVVRHAFSRYGRPRVYYRIHQE